MFCLSVVTTIHAQLCTNEKPVSFDMKLDISSVATVTMPKLDMERIKAEDKEHDGKNMPLRFGYSHKVNYNLTNSGTWQELPNGDKLWRLNVVCPDALSVNFCYDKFWIPKGGKFFVYSKDRKQSLGAFTSMNNVGDSIDIKGYATGLLNGGDMVLEYYQPREVSSDAVISIDYIVHGYRCIRSSDRLFGEAGICMVNINCEEGADWQNEKKAIARAIIQGSVFCSGALINTTNQSQEPYVLTGNHCISSFGDAAGYATFNNHYTVFYWDYEAPGCLNDSIEPTRYYTYGATIVANNPVSDFALLRLIEDPKNLPNYTPYYLGWDCSGEAGDPGVCIHHPKGDVKKISTVDETPVSSSLTPGVTGGSHWKLYWKETPSGYGTVEAGSSGSPLLNGEHKVIGQLHKSATNGCNNNYLFSRFGKFSVSWTGNSNDSICRRLNCWLDPQNTGAQTMEGLLVIRADSIINVDQLFYGSTLITSNTQLTIQSDIELMGNSRITVDAGSMLVIDGGTLSNVDLVLKPGASLRIINGGVIETRNGFDAPVGAIVDIVHGQII